MERSAAQRLCAWRKGRGLSQREAAALAGISQAAWYTLEAGKTRRVSLRLAHAVEVATEGEVAVNDWLAHAVTMPSVEPAGND